MNDLTPRQEEMFKAVQGYYQGVGTWPRLAYLAAYLAISARAAHKLADRIEQKKLVRVRWETPAKLTKVVEILKPRPGEVKVRMTGTKAAQRLAKLRLEARL